jgi:hypothetical protein
MTPIRLPRFDLAPRSDLASPLTSRPKPHPAKRSCLEEAFPRQQYHSPERYVLTNSSTDDARHTISK